MTTRPPAEVARVVLWHFRFIHGHSPVTPVPWDATLGRFVCVYPAADEINNKVTFCIALLL